jgi:hypothetical protein
MTRHQINAAGQPHRLVYGRSSGVASGAANHARRPARYSALATGSVLTMRLVFVVALRQTEGLIASVIGRLRFDFAMPDHSR